MKRPAAWGPERRGAGSDPWRRRGVGPRSGLTIALTLGLMVGSGPAWAQIPDTLPVTLEQVLASVEGTYPPLLAAQIERDVREGRFQAARGIFDLDLFGSYKTTPDGYYEYSTVEAGARQFLGIWGASVYGGYRLTEGDELPGYYDVRTSADGEQRIGLELPLLRGGPIDKPRADLRRAEISARGAGPMIDRQRIDFTRAATVAHANWVAAGRRLDYARRLFALAESRQAGLEAQVVQGLRADIVLVDNRRLLIDRELKVISAERDFEAAALALSLFFRDANGAPRVLGEAHLPALDAELMTQPDTDLPIGMDVDIDEAVALALRLRPEVRQLALDLERAQVDRSLAGNQLLPYLDATIESTRGLGDERYADRSGSDWRAGLSFKLPLQRREARGSVVAAEGRQRQLAYQLDFARQRVQAEVRTVHVALNAAFEQLQRADLNVDLALQLREAERQRFQLGASDLLALQIREQAAFDAQTRAVDARLDYQKALADFRAAVALAAAPAPEPATD